MSSDLGIDQSSPNDADTGPSNRSPTESLEERKESAEERESPFGLPVIYHSAQQSRAAWAAMTGFTQMLGGNLAITDLSALNIKEMCNALSQLEPYHTAPARDARDSVERAEDANSVKREQNEDFEVGGSGAGMPVRYMHLAHN